MAKKVCCPNCGAVSEVEEPQTGKEVDWLKCILPTGFEWILPSGRLTPVVGDPIYVSAFGDHLSRDDYMKKYNVDPEIAYTKMRAKGKGVRVGKE